MKNLHVLPTNKPSKLGYLTKKGKEVFNDLVLFDKPMPNILDSENQHIYITNDKEIKERDWCLDLIMNNKIYVATKAVVHNLMILDYEEYLKKIILTTDQDLIKDGVQAIDDDFLEWFVKNPSCIRVGVDKLYDYPSIAMMGYKIIIPKEDWLLNNPQCKQIESCSKSLSKKCICPKEEAKQNCEFCKQPISKYGCACAKPQEELKQETLEEAAENEASIFYEKGTIEWNKYRQVFYLGAKWQAKRMYSEDEVKELCEKAMDEGYDENTLEQIGANEKIVPFNKWFEQFKKK